MSRAIGRTNAAGKAVFDLASIESLGLGELTTTTPWTEGEQRFSGNDPRLLLAAVEVRGSERETTALDGYRVVVPMADFERVPMLTATRRDGRPMPVRERGPLWLVYPWSTDPETVEQPLRGRAIRQLRTIVVRSVARPSPWPPTMDRRPLGVPSLAGLCFLAALVADLGRLREQRAFDLEVSLRAGWFASRTEAHLLRFAAIFERFLGRGEPHRGSFHEQVDVLLLAVATSFGSRKGHA